MTRPYRDPGLDTLLELHGETLFVDDAGHWVKFVAVRAEPTPERPHGLSYSLTLHAPDGARLVGFDNAHPVRERAVPAGGGDRSRTTGIGSARSVPTSTRTRQRSSRISGRKWTGYSGR